MVYLPGGGKQELLLLMLLEFLVAAHSARASVTAPSVVCRNVQEIDAALFEGWARREEDCAEVLINPRGSIQPSLSLFK